MVTLPFTAAGTALELELGEVAALRDATGTNATTSRADWLRSSTICNGEELRIREGGGWGQGAAQSKPAAQEWSRGRVLSRVLVPWRAPGGMVAQARAGPTAGPREDSPRETVKYIYI